MGTLPKSESKWVKNAIYSRIENTLFPFLLLSPWQVGPTCQAGLPPRYDGRPVARRRTGRTRGHGSTAPPRSPFTWTRPGPSSRSPLLASTSLPLPTRSRAAAPPWTPPWPPGVELVPPPPQTLSLDEATVTALASTSSTKPPRSRPSPPPLAPFPSCTVRHGRAAHHLAMDSPLRAIPAPPSTSPCSYNPHAAPMPNHGLLPLRFRRIEPRRRRSPCHRGRRFTASAPLIRTTPLDEAKGKWRHASGNASLDHDGFKFGPQHAGAAPSSSPAARGSSLSRGRRRRWYFYPKPPSFLLFYALRFKYYALSLENLTV